MRALQTSGGALVFASQSPGRVETSRGALPDDLLLRARQGEDGWEVDRACRGVCPS